MHGWNFPKSAFNVGRKLQRNDHRRLLTESGYNHLAMREKRMKNDWNRRRISLMSEAKPKLRDRDGDNQEVRVWQALKELKERGIHLPTLDEIVERCDVRGYQASVPIRDSVKFHLRAFADPERNIVKVEF
jgi:hypothetical protein